MDIIYHGKSHDIFFRGKLYNRRQELTVADPMSQADFEALTRKDASTLYTVIYPGVPSDTIKKFIGNDEVNIITEVTCTAAEYAELNPPDPYTLYTVSYTNGTKIYLGKKEVGMSDLEYVSCTQSEYDELVSDEEINDYTIYTIVDDNDNPTGKKYFGLLQLIRLETLTKSEYDQLQVKDMNCFYTVTDGGTTKQYLGDLEIGAQMQKIEITQSAYDALTAYDNNTVYVVIDENNNYDVYFRGTMISQNRIREITLTSSEYEELVENEETSDRVLYILNDTLEKYLGLLKVGGEGGINEVELTRAEYDQLIENEEVDEHTVYIITDTGEKYYGLLRIGASVINIPAEEGRASINNGILQLDTEVDTSLPFEIVSCIRIDLANVPSLPDSKIFFMNNVNPTHSFYMQLYKDNGHLYFSAPFCWGSHTWAETDYAEIIIENAENVFNCDGVSKNFIKIIKTDDLKYQFWYSFNGVSYILGAEEQLPNNMTNLNTFTPIMPATSSTVAARRYNLNDIFISNCYIKQNGETIWGREFNASLIEKTVTGNGIYNASDEGAVGYSSITVQTQGQLIDPSKALIGYELDVSGGGEHSNSKGYVTDYIDVENFSKIFVRRYGNWTHAYFYDANKNAIQTVTSNDKITVPQGAKYYRLNDQVERVSDDIIIGLF